MVNGEVARIPGLEGIMDRVMKMRLDTRTKVAGELLRWCRGVHRPDQRGRGLRRPFSMITKRGWWIAPGPGTLSQICSCVPSVHRGNIMMTSDLFGLDDLFFVEPSSDRLIDQRFTDELVALRAMEGRVLLDEEERPLAMAVKQDSSYGIDVIHGNRRVA